MAARAWRRRRRRIGHRKREQMRTLPPAAAHLIAFCRLPFRRRLSPAIPERQRQAASSEAISENVEGRQSRR